MVTGQEIIYTKEQEKPGIRVDGLKQHGEEGKVVLFDDSCEHEVRNDTDKLRAVLLPDTDRPMDKTGTLAINLLFFSD